MFDEEINNIKTAINTLSMTNSPAHANEDKKPAVTQIIQQSGISSKDLNKIRETSAKVIELEEMLNKLFKYNY